MLPTDLEALAIGLASGDIKPQPLTPVQVACGVSAPLAHLAAQSLHPSAHLPPYTIEEELTFARLQARYHRVTNTSASSRTMYKLSQILPKPWTAQ